MSRLKKAEFKPKNYHYSLVEYLNKELKANNIKCIKRVSYIDIKTNNKIDNVYDKIIIDCFDGHIYLRGKDVNDKKLLKIRRFGGHRDSDAIYCAKGACKQIINLLNKLGCNVNNNLEKTSKHIDLRGKLYKVASLKKSKILDLRGKMNKISARDYAIAIINGEIYTGDTHGECVTKYLNDIGIEDIEFYDRIDLREILGYNFYSQFAAAHLEGNKIYLDNQSLENITTEQCVKLLEKEYPEFEICDYDTMQKLGIYLDKNNRDSAILYVNGEILEGYDYWQLMKEYAKNYNINENDYSSNDKYNTEVENIFDNECSYALGNKLNNNIYFEIDFLHHCSEDEIINSVKQQMPNYEIIFHEYDNDVCKEYMDLYENKNQIFSKRSNKMNRLVKKAINWNEIDEINKEIETFLKDNGWSQNGVGIFVNENYSLVDCIDTMTDQFMLFTTKPVDISGIQGIMRISSDTFAINSLDGLKTILQELK